MKKQGLILSSVVILLAMLLSSCSGAIPAVSEKAAAALDAQLQKFLPAEAEGIAACGSKGSRNNARHPQRARSVGGL